MDWAVEPLSGALGAIVHDADLRTVDDDELDRLRALIHEHQVVVLPGQHLDDEEHLAFGARLGPVRGFAFFATVFGDGSPEPAQVTVIRDDADSLPATDNWHTDVTWTAEPPDYAVLRSVEVPARGGDTMWASLTAAYDALSEPMRNFIDDLRVVHDNTSFIEGARTKMSDDDFASLEVERKLRAAYPPVSHPLVRTHPDTGARALFVAGNFMRHVEGLSPLESDTLLDLLRRHIDQPRFHLRWRWTAGDVAIWDERTTNHRGVSDHAGQVREIRRVEVGGSVPV